MIHSTANKPRVLKSNTADAHALAREVSAPDWIDRASLLKTDERTSVFSGECSLGPVIVKTMRVDRLKDRASKAVGVTRLLRQWKGWKLLGGAGIASPECFALWRDGNVETLVMHRVTGETLFEYIARNDSTIAERVRVARLVVGMLRAIDGAGLYNRDGKPSNLIVCPSQDRLWVIDTVGIRGSRGSDGIARMCANLLIEPIGLGNPARTTDCVRVLAQLCGPNDRRALLHNVRAIIARAGFLTHDNDACSGAHAREQ